MPVDFSPPRHASAVSERFCNLPRLLDRMERQRVDAVVAVQRPNVYYLSGYEPHSSVTLPESESCSAVILSRHQPEHPVLVVPDALLAYRLDHPSWVEDVRCFPTILLPFSEPITPESFDRFVPGAVRETPWGTNARRHYSADLLDACRSALVDLGLEGAHVGVDDLRFAGALERELPIRAEDGYQLLREVRQVKTADEIALLRLAASVNQRAIEDMVATWTTGATWRRMIHAYHRAALDRGGFFREPGAVVLANPPSRDQAAYLSGPEDFVVEPGSSMMLDCHGTVNHYCWDGGKTWVVAGERTGVAAAIERLCVDVCAEVEAALVPGARVSQVMNLGLSRIAGSGLPGAASALVFCHSLGMDHNDMAFPVGQDRLDWTVEAGTVAALHVLFPGDERTRFYIEDTVVVSPGGGASLYEWSMDPIRT
jgi:Xaa-Pro aminopeptidase